MFAVVSALVVAAGLVTFAATHHEEPDTLAAPQSEDVVVTAEAAANEAISERE